MAADALAVPLGAHFALRALDAGRYGFHMMAALVNSPGAGGAEPAADMAGAAAYLLEREGNRGYAGYLYVDYIGATGIAPGAGSALFAALIALAAERGLGFLVAPLSESRDFWRAVGLHKLRSTFEQDLGSDPMGLTAAEVSHFAARLRAPTA